MTDSPLRVWRDREGKLLRLRLARPKANIVDAAMIAALQAALDEAAEDAHLRGVLLDHEGPHFSFGASVQEHMPDTCADMIRALDRLILRMVGFPVPILVAVRGQCLGGGLEVACGGHLIFSTADARFGQPEIQLGVFAAAASCLLPERIGRAHADDLLFSGRSISGSEAAAIGLVNAVADEPEAAALAYFDQHLAPHSASSLRFAVRAARADMVRRLEERFPATEALYLEGLMATHDAVEGLGAFLAKRPPVWRDS
ncbi:MAG: cyclohexa-1,5-dienecarbonyl-CoA hydratase [Rhodospirillales bacterium]|nr:cyclohexa-1,5-dienecarbonyl-CoA hydratase [Rhodospirillales bacterium]